MKAKRKWSKRMWAAALAFGVAVTALPVYAAPNEGATGAGTVQLPAVEEIAAVDFSSMEDLDKLPGDWKIAGGSGESSVSLVDDGGEKAFKMQKASGGEISLSNANLGIIEKDYRYVSIETTMKMGTEPHSNQFSIPYLQDKSGNTVYTLYADGDWTNYKTHVNGKNSLEAGSVKPGEWQTIQMDIDMATDTFRVSVDGEYLLVGADARAKTDNLKSIKYYADSWNTGTIYLKSVKITAQKERTESAAFYVSNTGDDAADGQSAATAWKSIERVNQEHFIPGDQILFARGGIWENQTMQPQGSGSDSEKIVIGSYGEGDMPQIRINGRMKDAIYLCNQEYWEISGLDISNTVEGFTQISNGGIPTGNLVERDPEQGKLLGDYRGIHIAGRDVPTLKGFWLHDLKVHDVTGVVTWIGDTGLRDPGIVNNTGSDGSKRTGGLLIECLSPTGKQPTQFSDIVIEKNEFINNSFCGITVKQWNGSGNQYGENPGWANRNGSKGAPDYEDSNWYPHSNIIIQDNYINQGASAYACNGIYLTSSRDSVIQRNVLEHIGTCGIELYFTDNVAVQYNEVSDVVKKGGGADDNAIDPDWRVTNALIQYNYVYDCGEGFLLCGVDFNSGVIRYNLVQDCGRSYVHYSMGKGYFQIYNNVFYRSKDGNGTSNFDPWGNGKASYFNNVFYDGKGTGFSYSGGSNFSYYNNAYFGTKAPGKDSRPLVLTEDPFEGSAPSLDRNGSFETGVLLETNGLRPKLTSPLIGAGVSKDANGISIDEGLKEKGTYFNFTPLEKADTDSLGDCINISRIDYPTFEKKDAEATFNTAKTQTEADGSTPTIGLFEVPLDENTVILKGTVSDGINPLPGAEVEVAVNGRTVSATTGDSGTYSITEGLEAGNAVITVKSEGREDVQKNIVLEKGKVNIGDVKVPLVPMPDEYGYTIFNETFDSASSENFSFDKGSEIAGGNLVITKDMGNASAAVSYFRPEIAAQKGVDFSFDWKAGSANKMGLEFRDSYGRLLFAVCAAPDKKELRTSTTGEAVADEKAAAAAEPVWSPAAMSTDKTYTFRVHADFEYKTVSWQLKEKDGEVIGQQLNIPTDAVNLAKMNACSWWASKPQYIDNFKLTAPEENVELALKGTKIYAFGDSIVAGHEFQKGSFADFTAAQEEMELQKFAVNGATILDAGYIGGQILSQIAGAPEEEPQFVLFDGGTNDAEFIKNNSDVEFGTVAGSKEPDAFDTATFAGAFENTVYEMKKKWPNAQLVYVTTHKLGSRDNSVQDKLHEMEIQICQKWEIAVADLYEKAALDTNDINQKNNYTFDSLGSNGLPGINGSGTHPNLAAIEEFYVPLVSAVLKTPSEYIPAPELPETVEKDSLAAVIETAKEEAAKTEEYTEESIEALKGIIEGAEAVLNNPDALQEAVDEQVLLVEQAIAALVKPEDPEPADRTALLAKITEARKEVSKTYVYTPESISALDAAIEAAEAVSKDPAADQERINQELASLEAAIGALQKIEIPEEPGTDRTKLLDKLGEAEELTVSEGVYTKESMEVLKLAVSAAKDVLENPDATQEEVDAQITALQGAIDGLKPAGTDQPSTEEPGTDQPGADQPGTENPGNEQPDSVKQNEGNTAENGKGNNNVRENTKKVPKTGDTANAVLPAAVCLISLLAVTAAIIFKLKKIKNR